MKVERHRTAIQRNQLSRPVLVALRDQLLDARKTFFDYGCGRGQDLEYLQEMGLSASGWDPAHSPENPKVSADVVNLGYVINVIENPEERGQVLRKAFDLAKELLIVSAMVGFKERATRNSRSHNDGLVTQRGTFQKYFDQAELGEYIARELKRDTYPAAQGVFYVFASEEIEREYCRTLARESSSNDLSQPTKAIRIKPEHLAAIAARVHKVRRLPLPSEMPDQGVVLGVLASSDDWLQRLSGHLTAEERSQLRQERRRDIIRVIARSFFSVEGGKRMADLSLTERADVRLVFGSMSRAQLEVERYIRRILEPSNLEQECRTGGQGKLTPSALYFHRSQSGSLSSDLSLLTLCAEAGAANELQGTENIVKINFRKPGVSFAAYPEFEEDPHPSLNRAVRFDFASSSVALRDYSQSGSPPILHRKELFISSEHEHYQAWSLFTQKEESLGLLGRRDIGTKGSWLRLLASKGISIENGQLVEGEPYEIEIGKLEEEQLEEDFEVSLTRSKSRRRTNRSTRKPVWSDEALDLVAAKTLTLGRPPLPNEVELEPKLVLKFLRSTDMEGLLGGRFDPDAYEQKQRERWKYWVVFLAASRFGVTGVPKLKQLSVSARADIKAFFQSYRLACAEAEHWLLKIGQPEEIANAINTFPHGLHHPEKGLYLHSSLQDDLPVVLQLLLLCGRVLAGRSLPRKTTVARITPDGRNVKFYEYHNFTMPGPATRVQSVKVDFRRRKVIPRDFYGNTKQIWERASMLDPAHPAYQALKDYEEELLAELLANQNPQS